MQLLSKIDASIAITRSLWLWIGQVALLTLGFHLAADRVDDLVAHRLAELPFEDPQTAFVIGAWVGVLSEVLLFGWGLWALFRTTENRLPEWRDWPTRWSIHNVVAPLAWWVISAGGAWSIAMAIEDVLPPSDLARWGSWLAAAVVWGRLGLTAVLELALAPPPPKRRLDGLLWSIPVLICAGVVGAYGLPIWGW